VSTVADLVPHELIVEVALKLAAKDDKFAAEANAVSDAAAAAKAADAATQAAAKSAAQAAADEAIARAKQAARQEAKVDDAVKLTTAAKQAEDQATEAATAAATELSEKFNALVKKLARSSWLPDLVTFTGYAAEKVTWQGVDWQVLYTDLPLVKWLVVEDEGILYSTTVDDDASPFKKRDVIWVDEDASVGMGMGAQSNEARFLTGKFTRAGDFDSPPRGGTMAGSTGVFCEARTAGCCTKKSQGRS
jgi:hypothetical protein